jgi:hypothetical protein
VLTTSTRRSCLSFFIVATKLKKKTAVNKAKQSKTKQNKAKKSKEKKTKQK